MSDELDRGYPADWPFGNPHDRVDKVFALFLVFYILSMGFLKWLMATRFYL
jgi:hypothetical protein